MYPQHSIWTFLSSILVFAAACLPCNAAESQVRQPPARSTQGSIDALKAQLEALKADYDSRIRELEARVEQLQTQVAAEETSAAAAPTVVAPPVQTIPGALNPAISVIGNFVGRADSRKVFNDEGQRIDGKVNLREAEIDMRVPVDPYADGVLITSLESEFPGRFSVGVEEGYINIKKLPFVTRMPLGLRFKVGRFRPAFGKTNVLHTHDVPQINRSLATEEFLGEEGFVQNGISSGFFIPTPWDASSSLDATLEFLNGGDIAIAPDPGSRAAYNGHLRWFRSVADAHNVELGWSTYFRPRGRGFDSTRLHGVDFLYRWKPLRQGQWRSFLFGGEVMFSPRAHADAAEPVDVELSREGIEPGPGRPVGWSAFAQWQFDRRKYAGLRVDGTDALFHPGLKRHSVTPYLSYYFSEFLRFRLNFEHRWSDFFTEDRRNSVFVELNWVFGAHPPEPFWVNK